MIKKFSVIVSVLLASLFFTPLSLAEESSPTTKVPSSEIWHIRWNNNNIVLKALFAKRNAQSQYYGLWSNGSEANLTINRTEFSFNGTAEGSNGDTCTFNG